MRRHPCRHLDHLPRQLTLQCRREKSPPTSNRGAQCHRRPQRHLPLTTSCPPRAWGGEVPTRSRTIARMGRWHPCLLPQRRQSHRRARPILSCRLGLLPPTLYQRWGGAPPRWQAVLCLAVFSILAFAMSTNPGFTDKNPWVMEAVNAVACELQCWYQRHSIHRYLARQTRQCLAATTLQCWKQCIWLDRWFAQQYLQCQKCLRLQSLCRGASAYAILVWGDRRPPPTPTDKPSDLNVSNHPIRKRGQPLPPR